MAKQQEKSKQYEVQVIDLVKRYKELVAVDHLNLNIEKGDIFGLLGPNGSGKSTLINCILSLLTYDKGEIYIFGEPMNPFANKIKREIGLVPQDIAVYDELSVYENIDYFCGLYITDKHARKRNVEEVIDFVQLGQFRKMRPPKLSGGLKRRLNLACGIVHQPRLLFLDEPTVAVDPQSRNRILEGIREMNERGTTVVYTTHYMEEVELLCNRLAILDHGRIIQEGTSDEIIAMSSLGETIEMVIYDLPERLITALQEDPSISNLKYDNNLLRLNIKGENSSLLRILLEFEKQNIEPVSITAEKPTLNDVFLEITGKELRDNA